MKRYAAIVFAAFYLLISSGIYVCVFSCGINLTDTLFTIIVNKDHDEVKQMDCHGDEDCSCCKKHGSYTVKENVVPVLNDQIPIVHLIEEIFGYSQGQAKYLFGNYINLLPNSHPPPERGCQPVYIKIRSLLI